MLADRVIFQFIFMPIIRYEINLFKETHNEHRIRRQRKRQNHISGRPNQLATDRPNGRQYGIPLDLEIHQELSDHITNYGMPITWVNFL
jgi:hypothetical protein